MKIKRIICIYIGLALLLTGVCITDRSASASSKGALWTAAFSDPYFMGTSMTSTPIVTDDTVYVVNRDELYALDTTDGSIRWSLGLPARMNSVCDPALSGNDIYIPLSGGIITCVDTHNRVIRWSSESYDTASAAFQTLGRMFYHDGYIYAGTWRQRVRSDIDREVASEGCFFCVRCSDGQTMWRYSDTEHPAGYYWSRAVICKGRLFFTSEDGTLISHDPVRDTVYEKYQLTDGLMLRNGLCSDVANAALYTVSKAGTLIAVHLTSTGEIHDVDRAKLVPDAENPESVFCTSRPSLYEGRLYIGCAADGYGWLCVMDARTLTPVYRAQGVKNGEIKSGPLICPDSASGSSLSVYFTANENSGSLYMLNTGVTSSSGAIQTLFTPYSAKQFCLADVVRGPDGILYYSNDSGTLFAIGDTDHSVDIPDGEPADRVNVPAPSKVTCRYQKKKHSWKLSWKVHKPATATMIYLRSGSGSWKLYKNTTKNTCRIKPNKRTLHIRLRCYQKSGSIIYYSGYIYKKIHK